MNFLSVLLLTAILSVSRAEAEELLDVWTVQDLAPRTTLNDISSSSHGFITAGFWLEPAGGDGSTKLHPFVRRSSNGVDWVEYALPDLSIPDTWYPEAVTDGNGTMLAVGRYGRILSSTNGSDWVERYKVDSHRLLFNQAAFGHGRFVVAGAALSPIGPFREGLVSSAGPELVFSRAEILGTKLMFGETNFLTGGGKTLGTSADGVVWKYSKFTNDITALGYGEGLFVLGAKDGIYTSANGGHVWEKRYSETNAILAIAHGGGQFLATGNNGMILSSSDGKTWSKRLVPERVAGSGTLFGAAYANGTFLVLGQWINQARPDFMLRSINLDLARNNSFLIDPVSSREGFRFKAWLPTNQVARVQVSSDLRQWNDLTVITNTSANPMLITDPSATNKLARFYRTIAQ